MIRYKSLYIGVLILINVGIVLTLLAFQYLMFAFLPAIDPEIAQDEQRSEAIKYILQKNIILIIEAMLGLGCAFFINKKVLKLPNKKASSILFIGLVIMLLSMAFFSMDYINKFPL